MAAQSKNSIAKEIYQAATVRARRIGFQLGHGADGDIQSLANAGAERLVDAAAGKPEAEKAIYLRRSTDLAIEGIKVFIDEMAAGRGEVYTGTDLQSNIIGERTFIRARNILCPLWPFC